MFDSLKTRKRVLDLEEEMLKLAKIVQAHDLDWADMYARCKRLLDRTEKAAKRVVESEESVADQEAPAPDGNANRHGRLLTPHQQEIQQQILRRRGGL